MVTFKDENPLYIHGSCCGEKLETRNFPAMFDGVWDPEEKIYGRGYVYTGGSVNCPSARHISRLMDGFSHDARSS